MLDVVDETTVVDGVARVLIVRKVEGSVGRRITIEKWPFVIGRGSTADLDLDAEKASRAHAHIFLEDGRLFLKDLGSSNGTYINGELVTDTVSLRVSDVIRIADHELEYQEVSLRNPLTSMSATVVVPLDDEDA